MAWVGAACGATEAATASPTASLRARQILRDIQPQAELHLELPPGPRAQLRYTARMEAGTVAFSDTSRGNPKSFLALAAFTKAVTEDVCGLER